MDADQVAVVLPPGWGELNSLARLRLLQRQAQFSNQELALVTQDMEIRRAAQQVGIPVYSSEAAIMGRRWRMTPALPPVDPRRPAAGLPDPPPWRVHRLDGLSQSQAVDQAARPSLHRSRQRRIRAGQAYRRPLPLWFQIAGYALAGLFILALLAAFAYFVLPAATVTVVPGQQELETTIQLTANPFLEAPDPEAGLLPGRFMETYIELTGTTRTSGSQQAATERAQGQVVFTNQTNRTVRIPAGTIVSTSTGNRIDFRTLNEVEIPGPVGAQATVAVEALEPGSQGNVRANTITTVSGALRTQVRVTNPAATSGGQSALVSVVRQEDKDRLLEEVYAKAQEQAYEALLPELREDEWLPPNAVQTFIIAQFFDHFNDEPAEELNLTLRVLVQGVAVDEAAAREVALQALEEAVPERGKLVADSIQFLVDPNVTVNERVVTFNVTARGKYVIPIDSRELRAAITGMTFEEASTALQERWLLARPPEFYLDPDWFGTLPQIPSRIQVRVQFDEAARAENGE